MENSNYKNKNIKEKYLNTEYDWLINYIPEPIRKIVRGFKDKIVSLFKTNIPKQTVCGRGKKLIKPKTQKQSEEKYKKSFYTKNRK